MTVGNLTSDVLGPPGAWRLVRAVVIVFTIAAVSRMLPAPRRQVGSQRRRNLLRTIAPALVGTVTLATVGGCVYALTRHRGPLQIAEASMGQIAAPTVANASSAWAAGVMTKPQVGVFEPSATASYRLVNEFIKATGTHPGFVLYYSGWGDPFQIRFADWTHAAGAVPFVQMEPEGVRLRAIAAGRYDAYLRRFASAVRIFGQQVVIGFAPEMNGNWYGWGAGHTAPSVWVAAWRHVVNVFRADGTLNVTWLWTVNSVNAASAPLRQWWPGARYVSWVGIDGYYYRPADTFSSVFGGTITQVRKFTAAPILISETAAGPSPSQPAQIKDLFAGVRTDHLQGAVWFDMAQHDGPYHLDWRLEDSPAGLAAFRHAVETSVRNTSRR